MESGLEDSRSRRHQSLTKTSTLTKNTEICASTCDPRGVNEREERHGRKGCKTKTQDESCTHDVIKSKQVSSIEHQE